MSETLYKIRGLEWELVGGVVYQAQSPWGRYEVWKYGKGEGSWRMTGPKAKRESCNSPEEGKAKAEAHYLSRLTQALTPVESKEAELREDIEHAVAEAKKYQPDYPYTQNTASEAVWALGTSLEGTSRAINEDWLPLVKELKAALEDMVKNCNLFPNAPYCVKARAALAKTEVRDG